MTLSNTPSHIRAMSPSTDWNAVNFVSDKSTETHKAIRSLNKDMLKAKGRAEKEIIEEKIKAEKKQWWEDVKHLMVKSCPK